LARHVQRASAQRRHHGGVVTELGRGRHLHLDAAGRFGLKHVGELDGRFVAWVARRSPVAQRELRGLGLGSEGQGQARAQAASRVRVKVLRCMVCLLSVCGGKGKNQWINMPPFTSSVMPVQ
jgi:hypothetical protein